MIYCYLRASRDSQDFIRQEGILKEKGYIDGQNCTYLRENETGTSLKKREICNDLIKNKIKKGDTIVVTELSRIARSVKDFNNIIDEVIYKKEVNMILLKENFHLLANGQMDAMTKLILNITSCFAEFEADIISDRTREALKAKKLYGTKSGKPLGKPRGKNTSKENFIATLELHINGLSYDKATRQTGFPRATFAVWLREYRKKENDKKILLEKLKKGEL